MTAPTTSRARSAAEVVLLLLPAGLTVFLSFQAGGFFPGSTAIAALVLVLVLVVRLTTAPQPFEGVNAAWVACAALLALFAVWTLTSGIRSDAPARAILEYDRSLLYLLAFVTFGTLAWSPSRLRWMIRGLGLAATVVCVCALTTRLAPDVWLVQNEIARERLSYPLTYWNALGLLAAFGVIFCFGMTTDGREQPVSRVLAAAAVPLLCATAVLTFSRGSIAAAAAGLLLLVVVARPSLFLSGLLTAGPAAAVAVNATLGANLVTSQDPTTAAAVAQGHDLALTLALCTGAAALLRTIALWVDPVFVRLQVPDRLTRRSTVLPATAAIATVAAIAFVALGGVQAVDRQIDVFSQGAAIDETGSERFTNISNNGRSDIWGVALDGFDQQPLRGTSAGTWALGWQLRRPNTLQVNDGHSLYLEVLSELGVVGLVLIAGALVTILVGLAVRARGPDRGPAGILFAAATAWALHAGVDWDWEMPAVTLWIFAVGGLALGAARRGDLANVGGPLPRGAGRIVAGLACLLLALVPLDIARSQGPLQDARRAFARGDCVTAIDRALASSAAMASRPEPYYLVGLCDVRAGYGNLAVQALEKAVARDPSNWEYHYGLALVRGANRMDPRPEARRALQLNPREPLAATAVELFSTERPALWRQRALEARLPPR